MRASSGPSTARVAEARTDVGEIGAGDQRDSPPAGRDRLAQRVEEPGNTGVVVGPRAPVHRLVGEARQHRNDADVAPVGEEIAEEDGLELDRVLDPVGQLGAEAILTRARGERVDEVAIDRGGPQRAGVVLPGERERVLHAGVTGAEDHEEVGSASLRQLAIGPRVRGAAPVVVDVGRDHPAHFRLGRSSAVDRPRPVRRREEALEHPKELGGVPRVGSAGVGGRTGRRSEEAAVDDGAPVGKARALEESLLVERLGDLLDLSPLDELAVTAHHDGLDVSHRVLAVEERHDLEEGSVEQDDRVRVAAGIAQGDARPPLVLDGKGLHRPQPRHLIAHSRKFRAEAT